MTRKTLVWMLIVAVLNPATIRAQVPVPAAAVTPSAAVAVEPVTSVIEIVAGRSTVLDIGAPIARVSLTSADIADALVTSTNQLLLHGKTPGAISMFVWERSGTVRRYDVVVGRDVTRLTDQVRQHFPGEPIQVGSNGRDIVLSGTVSSPEVAERVVSLSAGFAERKEDVVSLLRVQTRPTTQVLLKVRFAEVSRQALTELGLSLFTGPTGIENTLGRVTTQQFSAPRFDDLSWTKDSSDWGSRVVGAEGRVTFSDYLNLFVLSQRYDLGLLIRALQARGLFQSLAEPNVVAESGKEASFLAGGEFPIPVAQPGGGNAITIEFKEFGVRLNFLPVVEGERIHLKVRPEVSTLDFSNGIQLQGFRIPALITRRTETELQLQDGQTFAIAGLLNNTLTSTLQKIPGIGDIPILGYLFRSKAAQKNRTELVVMITPQILTEGSPGVTRDLPALAEPYLPALQPNRSLANPPPAFGSAAAGSQAVGAAAQEVQAAGGTAPVLTAREVKALREAEARERREAARRAEAEARRQKAAADAERKRQQAEAEQQRRLAREQAAREAEAARRTAEAERRAQEQARRDAEAERKRQEAVEAAAARLRAAEAAYQAEVARSNGQ